MRKSLTKNTWGNNVAYSCTHPTQEIFEFLSALIVETGEL